MVVEGLIQAVTWFIVAYFVLINGSYLIIHAAALIAVRRHLREQRVDPAYDLQDSPFIPGIAVVVPAYNEAPVIASGVQSLLSVEYPDFEVVVVNDGSTDDTLARLRESFDLHRVEAEYPLDAPSEDIDDVYRADDVDLVVLDKENGGKADALNAGVFFTDQPLFCAVDADTVIERDALIKVVRPFLDDPDRTIATGGSVRVANGSDFRDSLVEKVGLSDSWLVNFQIMEYLRAFLAGRLGLNMLRSLLIVSGAFGLFRTNAVREIGGYSTDTVTEDMELVVRLHRQYIEHDRDYSVEFVPDAVVWTEVPETLGGFSSQRSRWYRGLLESLLGHRAMIGRRKYGVIGLVALPFFLIVEALGPIIEGVGYVIVPVAFVLGLLNVPFFALFLAVAVGLGTFMSWLGIFTEVYGFRRYDRPRDIAALLGYGFMENVLYRQWKAFIAWRGAVQFIRGDTSWGEMARVGIEDDETGSSATQLPSAAQKADITVTAVSFDESSIAAGETATVTATLENRGEVAGEHTLTVTSNEEVVSTEPITVAPGETVSTTVSFVPETAGTYALKLDDAMGDSLTVTASEDGTAGDGRWTVISDTVGRVSRLKGWRPVLAGLGGVLVALGVVWWYGRRVWRYWRRV
jgi:cellulose synthase/poly-beta-1,6-N-acetylglucosamine synthase-like glycosyltransferase